MVILLIILGWWVLGVLAAMLTGVIHATSALCEYPDEFMDWMIERNRKVRNDHFRRRSGSKFKIVLDYMWGVTIWPVRVVQYATSIPEINKEFEDFWFGQNEEA